MIRLLTLIAVIGFIVSVICLGGAAAFGGAAIDQGWRMPANWEAHLRDHDRRSVYFRNDGGRASEASRSLTWDGSPRLELSVPGELHYTQAPGPARITISGDRRVIDNVRIERGQITRVDPLIDVVGFAAGPAKDGSHWQQQSQPNQHGRDAGQG